MSEGLFLFMNKKLLSTILLFSVFIGFLYWGVTMLIDPQKDGETTVYALLILGCAVYALTMILKLPGKKLP